eukprot:6083105-Amphidinium_carterae.1
MSLLSEVHFQQKVRRSEFTNAKSFVASRHRWTLEKQINPKVRCAQTYDVYDPLEPPKPENK